MKSSSQFSEKSQREDCQGKNAKNAHSNLMPEPEPETTEKTTDFH